MNAEDLRLNNWVEIKDQEVKTYAHIEGIGNLQQVAGQLWSIDELEPIPLTEEWLERFGFEKTYSELSYCEYDLGKIGVEINSDKLTVSYNYGSNVEWVNFTHIKHVHSLQNLHKSLTGQELTITKQ